MLAPDTAVEGKYEASSVKNHGLPLSYLQIRSVEEGAEWYKAHTRYPDMVCDMLAHYEFGDLRYTTKKEFKNLRKRTQRAQADQAPDQLTGEARPHHREL